MQLVKLNKVKPPSIDNNIPDYAERQTPPQMPRLHMLCAVVGSRNSGKTTAVIKMLKMYVRSHSYDKIFWWSPTASREQKIKDFVEDCQKHDCEIDIIPRFNEGEFGQLLEWCRGEIDEYKEYKKKLVVWNKYIQCKNVDSLTLEELTMLETMDWKKPETTYKYGFPSWAMIWDDEIGNKTIFSPTCKGVTSQFWILHRHISCSVFILSQIVANGIPRQVRGNISLWMLFPCKSDKLKTEVAEELAFKIDPETFMKIWEFATKDQHDFLFTDYDCPDPKFMFRKGFTHLIEYTEKNEESKSSKIIK